MRRTLVIASVLTLLATAGLASTVLAQEPEPTASADPADGQTGEGKKEYRDEIREDRKELREDRKELKEDRKELREDRKELREDKKELRDDLKDYRKHLKLSRGNVSLDLAGRAVGLDNATYSFEISATGKAVERVKLDADADDVTRGFRYHARLIAHVVVKDENGTVVKEGDMRVHLVARGHGNETEWMLGSIAKRDNGMPKLLLKGEAEKTAAGVYDLTGQGRALFKLEGEKTPVKVTAVLGTFSFVPAATAAA